MQLVILANDQQKEEILSGGINDECKIDWISSAKEFSEFPEADAFFDLLFEENGYDISYVKKNLSKPVFVNSVNKTIKELEEPVIRINGWPGFLKRLIAEVCCKDNTNKDEVEKILNALNKKAEWVPDIKGFVAPRIVSMIINEAYFALEKNISTKEDIDIAMKLGTNYPYGPFEWAKKIGLKNIVNLLTELSLSEKRYLPAGLLLKDTIE